MPTTEEQGIANISQNNNIPTSGAIKFSDFRNVVNKVTAEINGNWQHCQIRHEVFGSTVYTSNLPKKININGQIGGTTSNPAIRFNSGGQGEMILEITNTGHGFPVRSYAAGAVVMVLLTLLLMAEMETMRMIMS